MHPIQIVYDNLTHILSHALGDAAPTNEPCTYCGRSAEEFGKMSYQDKDSYKQPVNLCAPCRSFCVTDIDVMGVERYAAGRKDSPVGNKFGMLPGTGWVYEFKTKRAVFLAPPGLKKKLPNAFLSQVETIEMTLGGHLEFLSTLSFPLLYIENFGRKTTDLIQGLTVSLSPKNLVCCSDGGISSSTRVDYQIDLIAAKSIIELMKDWDPKTKSGFMTMVTRMAYGRMSPQEATALAQKSPDYVAAVKLLPVDPHMRLNILRVIRKLG